MTQDIVLIASYPEPEGIVEIKSMFELFHRLHPHTDQLYPKVRRDKLLTLMDRLDPDYSALKKQSNDSSKSATEKAEAADKLAAREKHLQPAYQAIALLYADLHE